MQTRRVFLVKSVTNLAAFAAGGSLVIAGREQARQAIKNYNQDENTTENANNSKESENLAVVPKEATDKVGLPVFTIDHATDFAIGGVLGVSVKKIITSSLKLKQVNKELASTLNYQGASPLDSFPR